MLMFRPLYWFGLAGSAKFVPSLSLAKQPVFTDGDRTVTITMKGWHFADGQVVNARSVMFFLNMYKADPTAYCGYNAGYGVPDQVKSAAGHANTIRITSRRRSMRTGCVTTIFRRSHRCPIAGIGPSSSQSSTCATGAYGATKTNAACKAVLAYLTKRVRPPQPSPGRLWQSGDDGPWRLSAFNATGDATFEPNTKYQGPQKAQVGTVKEIAFTSLQGEESDLLNNKLSLGYIDPSVSQQSSARARKGGSQLGSPGVALFNCHRLVVGVQFRRIQLHVVGPQWRGTRPVVRAPSVAICG